MMDGLSVIIPTRGYSFNLHCLLNSIQSQQCDFAREVILIVNADSSLPYEQLKERLSHSSHEWVQLQIKLIYIDRPGVNRARNAGILAAQYELLIFLDDDCELSSKNLLQLHFQHHLKNPALFALGGLYHIENHPKYFDRLYNVLQMRWLYEGVKHEEGFRSHYLIGGHFSVKTSFLEEYKITFNGNIIYGGSELEFFLQANQHDLRIELSELSVLHRTNETLITLSKKLLKQGEGKAISEIHYPNQDDLIQNKQAEWTDSKSMHFFAVYLNYVFWFGYYRQKKQTHQFWSHLFQSLTGAIKNKRFMLLKKLDTHAIKKNQRGDRV